MIRAYSSDEAAQFILGFGSLPVEGGPILKTGLFGIGGATISTLADFVKYHYPPWGVIVHPGYKTDILVSYDARGNLHVIDVSKESIAAEVAKATGEPLSVVANVVQRTREVIDASGSLARQAGYTIFDALAKATGAIEKAIPDPKESLDKIILYGGIALVVYAVIAARK